MMTTSRISFIIVNKKSSKQRAYRFRLFQNLLNFLKQVWWSQVSLSCYYSAPAHKGKSHLMLNRSRRDIKEAQELFAKEANEAQDMLIHRLKEEVKTLRDELELAKEEQIEASKNAEMLNELYQKNVIDINGNVLQ